MFFCFCFNIRVGKKRPKREQTLKKAYVISASHKCVYVGNGLHVFTWYPDKFSVLLSSDLMQNPLIVPVKVLKGHKVQGELGRLTDIPGV